MTSIFLMVILLTQGEVQHLEVIAFQTQLGCIANLQEVKEDYAKDYSSVEAKCKEVPVVQK